jgi:xylulokinase
MKRFLLGIDLGTTNVKGILFDEDGFSVASSSATYKTFFPEPTQAEQDPLDWWDAIRKIITTITSSAGSDVVQKIAGICISSQTPTLLPVDKNGNPLRNSIIWMDKRSQIEYQQLLDKVGVNKYKSIVGGAPDVSFLPSKLLWYKTHEPQNFAKTHLFLQANSFINFKLTGAYSADLDQAALSQCLDVSTKNWSVDIASAIGIDLQKYFPTPVPCNTIIGHVTQEAADSTGLIEGIPVVAGTSDAVASMFAVGISKSGDAAEVSGTSSLIFVGHTAQTDFHGPVVSKPCAIDGIPYVFDAPISTTGASIRWYLDTLGKVEYSTSVPSNKSVYDILNEKALLAPAGSNGLIFFPYMMGERAPLWNTHAKGMFIGLSLNTKNEDIIRSILEGTSFALRHVLEEIKKTGATVNSLRVAGGGSLSKTWLQIKASVLNVPVLILDSKTGDVPFGDALIVGNAVGIYPNISESCKHLIQVREIVYPIPEWTNVYNQLFPYYLSMYQSLDMDLKKLEETIKNLNTVN